MTATIEAGAGTYQRTVTARIPVTLRALDPIHHGAGTAGNTALVRMQDSVGPDGERRRTPFVSGNSIRHAIRDALAWITVDTLQVPDNGLPKAIVDLLWSGGALTETGAQTDLRAMAERHTLLPSLPLLGYSLGSDIVRGSLRVSNAHLACRENEWRIPATVMRDPSAGMRAVDWMGEEFGTRHDVTGSSVDRLVAEAMFGDAAPASTQMIYDMQVIQAGSLWAFEVGVDAAVPAEVDALCAALTRVTAGGVWRLGARGAQGFGRCAVVSSDTSELTGDVSAAAARYVDHLSGHADAIRALLQVRA